jgi:hypothetical protein
MLGGLFLSIVVAFRLCSRVFHIFVEKYILIRFFVKVVIF